MSKFKPIRKKKLHYIYPEKQEKNKVYDLKYLPYETNLLLLNIHDVPKFLNKNEVTNDDYEPFMDKVRKLLIEIGLNPSEVVIHLRRIDYKIDVETHHKDLYMELLKKGTEQYGYLKRKHYDSSVYYVSRSVRINIYDKYLQLLQKNPEEAEQYKHILRFEIQINRPKIKANLKNEGICDELINYWNVKDKDYYFNEILKNIIYKGDYNLVTESRKKMKKIFKENKLNKVIRILSLIEKYTISKAEQKSKVTKETFRNYLRTIQDLNINPIPLMKESNIKVLKNIFNFTDDNIYLMNNHQLVNVTNSI